MEDFAHTGDEFAPVSLIAFARAFADVLTARTTHARLPTGMHEYFQSMTVQASTHLGRHSLKQVVRRASRAASDLGPIRYLSPFSYISLIPP